MPRYYDDRFPPQQFKVNTDRTRRVTIVYLPAEKQKIFWARAKQSRPGIVQMRRDMAAFIAAFNAPFQVSEPVYKEIMGDEL